MLTNIEFSIKCYLLKINISDFKTIVLLKTQCRCENPDTMCREKEKRIASCACAWPGPGTRCWDAGCFLLLAGAASCRLLGTTGGWTNYSSCVQQMWNMLEVGGRGKYSTHSTSRAALPSQLGPKIAVGKHSHLVFGLVEEQS